MESVFAWLQEFPRPPHECKRCRQVFGSWEELVQGFCEKGGHHCHTDEYNEWSRAYIKKVWSTYPPTTDGVLRDRLQECYQEYIQFCQHKLGLVSAEDELDQIWPIDDGHDGVTTTTIGQPTPEAHKTATARVITITRMCLLVSITFYVRSSYCISS